VNNFSLQFYPGVGGASTVQSMGGGDPVSAFAAYFLFIGISVSAFYVVRGLVSEEEVSPVDDFAGMVLLLSQVALTWLLFWSGNVF